MGEGSATLTLRTVRVSLPISPGSSGHAVAQSRFQKRNLEEASETSNPPTQGGTKFRERLSPDS